MRDSADGSENDLEEGTAEELKEDSKEDLKKNSNENSSGSCSKSEVSIGEEESSASTSNKDTSCNDESCDNSTEQQQQQQQQQDIISLRLNGSFFHFIPGSEDDIAGASFTYIENSNEAAHILEAQDPFVSGELDIKGNFMFMYHGADNRELEVEVVRQSAGAEAAQENAACPAEGITVTPVMSDVAVQTKELPAADAVDAVDCIENEASDNSDVVTVEKAIQVDEPESDRETVRTIDEGSLLNEIENCLQNYFDATTSEEETFETRLSNLICTASNDVAVGHASSADGEENAEDTTQDSADNEQSAEYETSEESEENLLSVHKVCLKKACTDISGGEKQNKTTTKKVFFLCNTEDFQQLLREEDDGEMDNGNVMSQDEADV